MLHVLGSQQKVCDKTTRRQLLQAGGAGLLGLTVPRLLAAEEVQPLATRRAKSVIFLFLFGGPSQFETFDMKPDAPSDLRGPYSPIASRTPGLRICEHLPLTASVSDKFCVIRNMSHPVNSHQGGSYYIQTGHRPPSPESVVPTPGDRPSLGSLVEYLSQRSGSRVGQPLPHYFVVPNYLGRLHVGGHWRFPGEYAGWLGRPYDPMTTVVDKKNEQDNPYYRACSDAELTFQLQGQTNGGGLALDRSNRRQSLLGQFDAQRRVADQIDVLDGGRIVNAEGRVNEEQTFGRVSAWVDYSGPVTRDAVAGVSVFPIPESDGHPWHTRDYGPMWINPWQHEPMTLHPGQTYTIGARFVAHDGSCEDADVARLFRGFREGR